MAIESNKIMAQNMQDAGYGSASLFQTLGLFLLLIVGATVLLIDSEHI